MVYKYTFIFTFTFELQLLPAHMILSRNHHRQYNEYQIKRLYGMSPSRAALGLLGDRERERERERETPFLHELAFAGRGIANRRYLE